MTNTMLTYSKRQLQSVFESGYIQAIEMPHSRRFPGKAVDNYCVQLSKVLDNVDVQFADHFDQEGFNCRVSPHQAGG